MKKLITSLLALISMTAMQAQTGNRVTVLQGARNLAVNLADGSSRYYLVSSEKSHVMHRLDGGRVTIDSDTFNVADISSMRFLSMPRFSLDEDSTAFAADYSVSHGLLAFRRTLNVGKWNSIVVPFPLTAAQLSDSFGEGTLLATLKAVVESDVATVEFETVDTSTSDVVVLQANKHYLIRPTRQPDLAEGVSTSVAYGSSRIAGPVYVIPNVTMENVQKVPSTSSVRSDADNVRIRLKGTYYSRDLTPGTHSTFMLSDTDGLFHQLTTSTPVKAFRSWIEESRNSQELAFRFYVDGVQEDISEQTAVADIRIDGESGGLAYDLQGRKMSVARARTGIYIVGGKKFIIK